MEFLRGLNLLTNSLRIFAKKLIAATEHYCDALERGTDREQSIFALDMQFAQKRFEFYALERAELYAALDKIQ